ncbi:putative isomerase YddE [Defluviimonas aquaemixtae]|uniref:Putative isomerase YddE n=1 Tax=Albidovulum aquaemixtae TaxID=1542388 RepID=A0A2R8B6V2_9RHOB|nr:PhzF family phenazine biosynthesis isomerase [Defluviimonas aquaemixtae]SPH18368.1 putative isomerase YddE [Defluviimonas aquaemixtae]
MREFTMFQVDAFTDRVFAGNPAAVLVSDAPLPEPEMQAIAAENNLAETVFVTGAGAARALRWFTPVKEVAFCGHATLASAHVLATEYGAKGPIAFATRKVGELIVIPRADGAYDLDFPALPPDPLNPLPDSLTALFNEMPVAGARNFENFFVELASSEAVRNFAPDLAGIAALDGQGLCITAKGGRSHDGDPVDFVSRYFAPAAGIPEDPVTGSTHATLIPYWADRLGREDLAAFQASPRGGSLRGRRAGDRVILTARAVTFMRATIVLPS